MRTGWEAIVALALDEDLGVGDITSLSTVAAGTMSRGTIVAKAPGVMSGLTVAAEVFRRVDASISFVPLLEDGQRFTPGRAIAEVAGPAHGLLAGERVALNLLQRLAGVATLTAAMSLYSCWAAASSGIGQWARGSRSRSRRASSVCSMT